MDKLHTVLLTVARLALAAMLCVTLVIALLCSSLRVVFERGTYTNIAETDAVVSALYTEVLELLESECLFYDLPYDTMKTALSEDTVKTVLTAHVDAAYETLQNGEPLPTITLDSYPFKAAIDSFFNTLPVEERPLDPDASATIATELSQSLSHVMSMGIGNKVLQTAHPLFVRVHRFADTSVWWLFAVIVLTAVSLIPVKATLRQRAYSTTGALFLGSALIAVPTWLFVGLDFPDKLAIGDSALREFVNTVLYTVIDRMNTLVTAAFIVSLLLLIASIVWVVKVNENKTAS